MVIKLQSAKILIFMGLLLCVLSTISMPLNKSGEAISEMNKTSSVLIIDPGHGGTDGGAVGADGCKESEINLSIANKLNLLSKLCGVTTVMTRCSEEIDYPNDVYSISQRKVYDQKARLGLIQDYPYGILYSIHQNTYPSEKIKGFQVLYGHDESSQRLGELLQMRFNESISGHSHRAAAEISNDIYLLRNCRCTSVLVECGFLSNREECKLLQNDAYQKKLSVIMLCTFMEYTNL